MADFQRRKRPASSPPPVTRRKRPAASQGGRTSSSSGGLVGGRGAAWAEHRERYGPPATFRHRIAPGESGYARVARLQRETPGCQVCGDTRTVYRRDPATGADVYRCPMHLAGTVGSQVRAEEDYFRELRAIQATLEAGRRPVHGRVG